MIDQEKQKERLIQAEAKYKEWTKEFLNTHCEYKADKPFDMNFIIAALWLKITDTVENYINLQADNEELKERLNYIWAIGCDYDGANPNDATQMRQLVDELVGIAVDGLEQTVFCNDEKTEIQPRAVKLRNLKMENARLTEQLENSVQLPKPYIIVTWNGKYEVWQSRIDTFCSVAEDTFDTLPEALARLAELGWKE